MADITIHASNRYGLFTTILAQFYGAQTSTNFEVISASGILIESNVGTGFTYGGNGFSTAGPSMRTTFSMAAASSFSAQLA